VGGVFDGTMKGDKKKIGEEGGEEKETGRELEH